MTPYFTDGAAWATARRVLQEWLGTPHRHHWAMKQRGADCALFVGGVLVELGILVKMEVPEYSKDWFMHTKREVIREAFSLNINKNVAVGFKIIEVTERQALVQGDILGFSTVPAVGSVNHTGIFISVSSGFCHCVRGQGVAIRNWAESWEANLKLVCRVMVG